MAKNQDVKTQQEQENIFESAEALQHAVVDKPTEFLKKNNKALGIVGIALLVIVAAGGFYFYTQQENNKQAQVELFPAIFHFEKDSLDKALKGDINTAGLEKISDEFGSTDAGELASFYAGVSYLKKGEYDKAIAALKSFTPDDFLVQARAYSLIGDAYFEKGEVDNAIDYYKKAANHKPNEQFTPYYLTKLAYAYEKKGDFEAAVETYQGIIEEYPNIAELNEVKRDLGYAQGKLKK